MSNISEERLVIAAVKGNRQAIKLLKERLKPCIRDIIKRGARSYTGDMEMLETHILEEVVNSLASYQFTAPFQSWLRMRSINTVISYIRQHTNRVDQDVHSKKSSSKAPRNLSRDPVSENHPPSEKIDFEIRSLVSLLNRSLDIRTTSSCSGHPDQEKWETRNIRNRYTWNQHGGWIRVVPVSDSRRALDFLVGVMIKLDNTGDGARQDGVSPDNLIRQRYQQVDADALFCSGIPIVIVGIDFRFFSVHPDVEHRLEIWKHFITTMRELIQNEGEPSVVREIYDPNFFEFSTSEAGAKYLQQVLHQLPFMLSAQFETNLAGYPGVCLRTMADLALFNQFSALTDQLHERLDEAGYTVSPDAKSAIPFAAKWTFNLQPFLNQELIPLPHLLTPRWEPRTREDHLKIWKLIELAVTEMVDDKNILIQKRNKSDLSSEESRSFSK